jgi:hypothetical protein
VKYPGWAGGLRAFRQLTDNPLGFLIPLLRSHLPAAPGVNISPNGSQTRLPAKLFSLLHFCNSFAMTVFAIYLKRE